MEHAKEAIEGALEVLAFGIEVVAGIILVIGAARFLVTVGWRTISGGQMVSKAFAEARVTLGTYILAGLEFLIVADILFTIVNRTLNDVIVLAIVASVRTLISVFLERELKGLRENTA